MRPFLLFAVVQLVALMGSMDAGQATLPGKCETLTTDTTMNNEGLTFNVQYCGIFLKGDGKQPGEYLSAVTVMLDADGSHRPSWPSENLRNVWARNAVICYRQSKVGVPESDCASFVPDGVKVDKAMEP